jgi:hypothetical protein
MAYNFLLILIISAETERVFSNTKYIVSPTRTYLGTDIIEAEEYLQA